VAASGDYTRKPRPVLIVQADRFDANDSIAVCPLTTDPTESLLRIPVDPTESSGLSMSSRVMIDKIAAVRRSKLSQRVGALTDTDMVAVNRSLLVFLGIA
jgi:mRNA interferase MazF